MMKRSKIIEARQQSAIEQKSTLLKNLETAENLKITPLKYHSDILASYSDVSISYDDKCVCKGIFFSVHNGDRIVLDGKNGSGKSSLMKLLFDNGIKFTGDLKIGSGLIISYVPQNISGLFGSLKDFAYDHHIDETQFKTILRKMGFEQIQFDKNMESYSAGAEKESLAC